MIVRLFIGEPCHVPSPSMEPAICVGDWIWIDKQSYGPIVPARYSDIPFVNILTWIPNFYKNDRKRNWGFHRLPGNAKPDLNDIIVFNSPDKVGTLLIKRIAKVIRPGTIITINSANLKRYESILKNEFDLDEIPALRQKLQDNFASNVCLRHSYYFVLGDNKDLSLDSRLYGYICEKDIIGRARIVLFNFSKRNANRVKLLKKIVAKFKKVAYSNYRVV